MEVSRSLLPPTELQSNIFKSSFLKTNSSLQLGIVTFPFRFPSGQLHVLCAPLPRLCHLSCTLWSEGSFTPRSAASTLLCKFLHSLCYREPDSKAKALKLTVSLVQLPFLTVRQPDGNAVAGQRRVRAAPAATLPGYDGTPGGRPVLGEDACTLNKNHHGFKLEALLIVAPPSRSTSGSWFSAPQGTCCRSTSSATAGRCKRSGRRRRKTPRSTSRSTAPTSPRPTSEDTVGPRTPSSTHSVRGSHTNTPRDLFIFACRHDGSESDTQTVVRKGGKTVKGKRATVLCSPPPPPPPNPLLTSLLSERHTDAPPPLFLFCSFLNWCQDEQPSHSRTNLFAERFFFFNCRFKLSLR